MTARFCCAKGVRGDQRVDLTSADFEPGCRCPCCPCCESTTTLSYVIVNDWPLRRTTPEPDPKPIAPSRPSGHFAADLKKHRQRRKQA